MKAINIFIFFSLLAFSTRAQNFLIYEDFSSLSDTTPPSGWINTTVKGNTVYDKFYFESKIFHPAPPVSDGFAVFDAYNGGSTGGTATNAQAEEVTLQLPDVSTVGLTNFNVSFSKQTFVQDSAWIHFEVSVDTGKTWRSIWSQANGVVDGTPNDYELNIDIYKGYPTFSSRFRWVTTTTINYRGFFILDNVALFEKFDFDVSPVDLVQMYDQACPMKKQAVEVEVKNVGFKNLSGILVHVNSGSYSSFDTIPSLSQGKSTTIVMPDSINTENGGIFSFQLFTSHDSDKVHANDTIIRKRSSSPPPTDPNPKDVERCGTGTVVLSTDRGIYDSTFWFSQKLGGSNIGQGTPFETPVISSSQTFYCENSRLNKNDISSFAGLYRFNITNTGPGSMFNVYAKNDIIIDSLAQHFAYSGKYDMKVYVKIGSYRGSETNQNDWKELKLVNDTLSVNGYGRFYSFGLKDPLHVPAGTTMAFYVDTDFSSITFTNGKMDIDNSDVNIEGNTVLTNDFSGVLTNFYWNGKVFYRKLCSSERFSVNAVVLSPPVGSKVSKGAVFEGQFRAGTESDPDIVAEKKVIEYELLPPTGFLNSDYGNKWVISEVSLLSKNGVSVPSADTSVFHPGAQNGKVVYRVTKGWADSIVLLSVVISDLSNSCDSSVLRYIYIAPTPVPKVDFKNVCDGEAVSFENLSYISKGFLYYHWDFGDGNEATSAEPIYTYDTFGVYTVTLTLTTDNGIKADTTFIVEVYEIPLAEFTVESSCEGTPASFINTTTIGSGTLNYLWDFGDNTTSVKKDPSHQYGSPGSYQVTLKAFANGCISELTKNANLFARPVADFDVEGACSGAPIRFTNTSTISSSDPVGSYWRFGDGTVGTLKDIYHQYTKGDVYDVEMVAVTQFGCKDSIIKQVTILPAPQADFTFLKACENLPVEFKNLTTVPKGLNVVYVWDFGDGDSSTQFEPSHKYGQLGEKVVTLTVNAVNGCESAVSKELKVSAQPAASFIVNDGCSGKVVQFINTTKYTEGSISYKWFFGDQDSSDFTSPTHVYDVNSTSTFNVTLEAVIDGGCVDKKNKAVTIEQTPECGFTATRSDSIRTLWYFTPDDQSLDPSAYTWVFEGSGTQNGVINAVNNFEFPETQYRVILRIRTDNGCECIDSTTYVFTSWSLGDESDTDFDHKVYPDPATDLFYVQFAQKINDRKLEFRLADCTGKTIFVADGKDLQQEGLYRIPVLNFASGIYFLHVLTENNHAVSKVVIKRQ